MKQLFILSKENINISVKEVIHFLNLKTYEVLENFLITTTNFYEKSHYLAYTKEILEILSECELNKFNDEFIKSFDWNKYYKKNFALKLNKNKNLEKTYSSIIFNNIQDPIVKLDCPETLFKIIFTKNKVFICKHIVYTKDYKFNNYESHKTHKRPYPHPSSLHPKLARAMVNMLGQNAPIIVDPFCGSGGILIEAGLTKHKIIGFDIDKIMLKRAYYNLKFFNINEFTLELRDACDLQKVDYFVTDLPYGKNTKAIELNELYNSFFKELYFKKAVIGFPDFVDYKKIIKRYNLIIKEELKYKIHKSLNKIILIITMK